MQKHACGWSCFELSTKSIRPQDSRGSHAHDLMDTVSTMSTTPPPGSARRAQCHHARSQTQTLFELVQRVMVWYPLSPLPRAQSSAANRVWWCSSAAELWRGALVLLKDDVMVPEPQREEQSKRTTATRVKAPHEVLGTQVLCDAPVQLSGTGDKRTSSSLNSGQAGLDLGEF